MITELLLLNSLLVTKSDYLTFFFFQEGEGDWGWRTMAGWHRCLGGEESQTSKGEGIGREEGEYREKKRCREPNDQLCFVWFLFCLMCNSFLNRPRFCRRWMKSLVWPILSSESLRRKRGCVTIYLIYCSPLPQSQSVFPPRRYSKPCCDVTITHFQICFIYTRRYIKR